MKARILAALTVFFLATTAGAATWDKTFPKNDKVDHEKVAFYNRLGIRLVADLYRPKHTDPKQKLPAIIVGHPYGGVKEQTSGLYAQTMAERGFVTLAWDASYGGESGGQPRRIASHEAYVEDFSAAVDFIGTRPYVDRERIGVIGICAGGGFALSAAAIDPRMRAIATISMYDTGRTRRQGVGDTLTEAEWRETLEAVARQRYLEFEGAEARYRVGTPETLPDNANEVVRDYYDYYRTPRGYHPRCTTAITFTSTTPFMNFYATALIDRIAPRPILFIAGDRAYSRYLSEEAYANAAEPKELMIIPDASHVDLYDRLDRIPFDKLASYFLENLN